MGFVELTKQDYIENLSKFDDVPFMQIPQMIEFLENRNNKVKIYGYKLNNELVVTTFVYFKKMFGGLRGEINGGPLYLKQEYVTIFLNELKKELKKLNCIEFVFKPIFNEGIYDSSGNLVENSKKDWVKILTDCDFKYDGTYTGYKNNEANWYYLKDLKGYSPSELLKSFNKNAQRNIKYAKNIGVSVRTITKVDDIPNFKKIVELTGKRQGFEDNDLSYYISLFESLGNEVEFLISELNVEQALAKVNLKIDEILLEQRNTETQLNKLQKQKLEFENLLANNINKISLSCMLLIYSPTETTYVFGGSVTEYQKYSGQFLIQYEAMIKSMERKVFLYNFLGIAGLFENQDGVLKFKKNFNGYVLRKYGVFRYHPRPIKFLTIKILKKVFLF